tara:strand:+ start:212 stop:790 length:579 start_codon:yes stop_codon:yes gene_type:complete
MVKNIRQELDKGTRYHAASDKEKKLINPNFKKSNGDSGVYYVARCFGGYVEFNGKANRPEFWYFALFIFILNIIALIIDVNVFNIENGLGPATGLLGLFTILPYLAVTSRRLHDTGRSGWWQLIGFTGIGLIPLIIWLASEGDVASTNSNKKTSVKSQEVGTAAKLRELNQLYKEGVITKKEFTEAKKKYLK